MPRWERLLSITTYRVLSKPYVKWWSAKHNKKDPCQIRVLEAEQHAQTSVSTCDLLCSVASGIDPAVLEQPRSHGTHCSLVCCRELLQRAARVEGGEELPIFILAPGLASFPRHLCLAALKLLYALQGRRGLVQRTDDLGALVGALGREYFPGFRVDAIGETANDCKGLCLVHGVTS